MESFRMLPHVDDIRNASNFHIILKKGWIRFFDALRIADDYRIIRPHCSDGKGHNDAVVVAAVYHTPAHFVAAVDGEAVGRLSDRHAQRP